MTNINYIKTEPVNVPVRTLIDGPASEVVILESIYRRIGLDFNAAIKAAWSDYAMFQCEPPPERRFTP
jgi:hypothetical protein